MAAANVATSAIPTSFVYEDLISQVQAIQYQIIELTKCLEERQKNDVKVQDELRSRSLVFVDPYGNQTVGKYMDHELFGTVYRKYKKDYVPRYLHQRIKVGTMNGNMILPLDDRELKSTVSTYTDGDEFITYGEITVWLGDYESSPPRKLVLRSRLTDNMEKITMNLKERHKCTNLELKSCTIDSNQRPSENNWNEGTILKSEDTVMSGQLYQDNYIIMAKLIKEKVNSKSFFFQLNIIFVFIRRTMLQMPVLIFKYL